MSYDVPDAAIAAILDAPPTPASSLSPDGALLLLVHYEPHPPIALLARPYRALAGIRLDPETGLRRRTTLITSLSVVDVSTGVGQLVVTADSIGFPTWAPDSSRFAYTLDRPDGLELVVHEDGTSRPVEGLRLSDVLTGGQLGGGGAFGWSRDSQWLWALAVPEGRREPSAGQIAPVLEETSGKRSQMATFADLLQGEDDEDAFETWGTTQLVEVRDHRVTPRGAPGLFTDITPSPNDEHLLVERLLRPFSARVPYPYFTRTTEVWTGDQVTDVATIAVSDEVPSHGVPTGARGIRWAESQPETLWWIEALDGGDPRAEVDHRDRLMACTPGEEPQEWARLGHRVSGLWPLAGGALVRETDRDRRWLTTWLITGDDRRLVFARAQDDAYGDPGSPVVERHADGSRRIAVDGTRILLSGDGAGPDGNRPFLDWYDLANGTSERVLRCAPGTLDVFLGRCTGGFLVRHESPTEPPNYHVVGDEHRALTAFPDPHPPLGPKRLVTHDRGDGVQLSGVLHLPVGHDPERDGPLPLVLWAYPDDFGDAATAGQVRSSPGTFTRLAATGPVWFTLLGFAVLVDATMPVIGDPETMNDTFVEQIASAAGAHITALAEQGVVDPTRVVAAGHSYGAFMTANLLAHTDLFAAGIARSGAYNRTLTPFGFQNERRPFWEAKEVYDRLSPFRVADQIASPLLLVHGQADNNPGTYPIQSERLFRALQATGGTARLVLLPHEGHSYQARESVLHVLAEQFSWVRRWTSDPVG